MTTTVYPIGRGTIVSESELTSDGPVCPA